MANIVTPSASAQSTSTAMSRLMGTPIAWSVTPEEYMSRLLIANSWTMHRIRNASTNQAGKKDWWAKATKALAWVPTSRRKVPTAAPSVMIRISGRAVPRKTQPTMAGFELSGGQ